MTEPHQYGYTTDDAGQPLSGLCSTGAGLPSCAVTTSHVCHGAFHCLPCLGQHVPQVGATFAGDLTVREVPRDDDADPAP